MHVVPGSHDVPTPVQLRHVRPSESLTLVIASPQAVALAAGHGGQHAPSRHSPPASHRVPRPVHASPPAHVAGMSTPHATSLAARHSRLHSQRPSTQPCPRGHAPSQRPPQPSGAPHAASGAHEGTHSQSPVSGLHSSSALAHGPQQNPPQPSGVPHAASAGQRRTQAHTPPMQRSGAAHGGSQPHVATQRPSWQTAPRSHVTPAHGFVMHAPARQNCPSGQRTPSHRERGVHVR